MTRIRTWVVAATTRSTNHYTITAITLTCGFGVLCVYLSDIVIDHTNGPGGVVPIFHPMTTQCRGSFTLHRRLKEGTEVQQGAFLLRHLMDFIKDDVISRACFYIQAIVIHTRTHLGCVCLHINFSTVIVCSQLRLAV